MASTNTTTTAKATEKAVWTSIGDLAVKDATCIQLRKLAASSSSSSLNRKRRRADSDYRKHAQSSRDWALRMRDMRKAWSEDFRGMPRSLQKNTLGNEYPEDEHPNADIKALINLALHLLAKDMKEELPADASVKAAVLDNASLNTAAQLSSVADVCVYQCDAQLAKRMRQTPLPNVEVHEGFMQECFQPPAGLHVLYADFCGGLTHYFTMVHSLHSYHQLDTERGCMMVTLCNRGTTNEAFAQRILELPVPFEGAQWIYTWKYPGKSMYTLVFAAPHVSELVSTAIGAATASMVLAEWASSNNA